MVERRYSGRRGGPRLVESSSSDDAYSPAGSSDCSGSGSSSNSATDISVNTWSSTEDSSGGGNENGEKEEQGEETTDLNGTTRPCPFPGSVLLSLDTMFRLNEERKQKEARASLRAEDIMDIELPSRKRSREEGSEGLGCRSGGSRDLVLPLPPSSEEPALARAQGPFPETREQLSKLSLEEFQLQFMRVQAVLNSHMTSLVSRVLEKENANIMMTEDLKITKDRMEGAIRERDELATALGVANKARDAGLVREGEVRAQLGDAETQLVEAKQELAKQKETMLAENILAEEARKTLEETKRELDETRAKLVGVEKAMVDAKALHARKLRKERDEGVIRFLASPEGKDEVVAGQLASHKRGLRMGVRQAVRKFSSLSPDVKYFEPSDFDEAKEFGPSKDSLPRSAVSSARVITPTSKGG